MSEKVEQVARALARQTVERALRQLFAAHSPGAEPSERQIAHEVETAWPHHVEDARTAIAAMREPTRAMVEAGMNARTAPAVTKWMEGAYNAMLDEALR